MAPSPLDSTGLEGARAALAAPPPRPRLRTWVLLLCAALMSTAAASVCAVVILGGWAPQAGEGPPSGVRVALRSAGEPG